MLAERRRHRNLTWQDLAQLLDAKVSQIRRLEEGRWVPSPPAAWTLAEALGLEPEAFADWALCELFRHPDWLAENVLSEAA